MAEGPEKSFDNAKTRFISCSEESCRMFNALSDVQAAYQNKEISEVRVMSKDGKTDVVVDINSKNVRFGKNPFGNEVLFAPKEAVRKYKEPGTENPLSPKAKH